MILIDQIEVIEVSPDFPCRFHGGIQFKLMVFRKRRELCRQHIFLNLGGDIQLGPDLFLFTRHGFQANNIFLEVMIHLHKRIGEIFQFIIGMHIHLELFGMIRIILEMMHHRTGCFVQLFDRPDQEAVDAEVIGRQHDERHRADDDNVGSDQCQQHLHNFGSLDIRTDHGSRLAVCVKDRIIRTQKKSVFRVIGNTGRTVFGLIGELTLNYLFFFLAEIRIRIAEGIDIRCHSLIPDIDDLIFFGDKDIEGFQMIVFRHGTKQPGRSVVIVIGLSRFVVDFDSFRIYISGGRFGDGTDLI